MCLKKLVKKYCGKQNKVDDVVADKPAPIEPLEKINDGKIDEKFVIGDDNRDMSVVENNMSNGVSYMSEIDDMVFVSGDQKIIENNVVVVKELIFLIRKMGC